MANFHDFFPKSARDLLGGDGGLDSITSQLAQLRPYGGAEEIRDLAQGVSVHKLVAGLEGVTASRREVGDALAEVGRGYHLISTIRDLHEKYDALIVAEQIAHIAGTRVSDQVAHIAGGSLAKQIEAITGNNSTYGITSDLAELANASFAIQAGIGANANPLGDVASSMTQLLTASLHTYEALYGPYRSPFAPKRRVASPSPHQNEPPSQPVSQPSVPMNPGEAVDAAADAITTAVSKARVDALSAEFYLNMLITLLLFALQCQLSTVSQRRLLESVKVTETSILKQLAPMAASSDQRQVVYSRRVLDLRTLASPRARIVGEWYPNVPGRILSEHRRWIEVEYFDRSQETHIAGWCLKKYVMRQGYQ